MNLEILLPQLLRGIQNLPEHCKIELLKNVELLPNELPDFCREVEGILDANFDERVHDWMREKTSKDQMLELAALIDICDPGLDPEWIEAMNGAICAQQSGTPSDTLQFVQPYRKDKKDRWTVKKNYQAKVKVVNDTAIVTFLDLPKTKLIQFVVPANPVEITLCQNP